MNLIISGDSPKKLARIEALAQELGLSVRKDLKPPGGGPDRIPRRFPKTRAVEKHDSSSAEIVTETTVPRESGPLYGIE